MAEGHRGRLIEKGLRYGFSSLKQHEVLELMLFFSYPRVDTNPIAHNLIKKFGSLYNVCNAPIDELIKVDNVGKKTAEFIKLLPEFARSYELSAYDDKQVFCDTKQLGNFCVSLQIGNINEVVYVLCFDLNNRLIRHAKIAEGTPGEVQIEARKVIEQITHTSTSSVVLCHNHPSGSLFPSQNDFAVTSRIKQALSTIDVSLIDHIIVAGGNYISFKEELLKF